MQDFEKIEGGAGGNSDICLARKSGRRFGVYRLFRGLAQHILVVIGVFCIFQIIKVCIFGENDMSLEILKIRIAELILTIGL